MKRRREHHRATQLLHYATDGSYDDAVIERGRKRALFLIAFGIARMGVWTVFAILVTLGLIFRGPFHWASLVAATVTFVTYISLYANWATDFDQVTAAMAALAAIDARRAAEHAAQAADHSDHE